MGIIQSFFRRFSIGTRMVGAVLMVMALLLVVGATGLGGMYRLKSLNQGFVESAFASTDRLVQLTQDMGDVRRLEKDMIIQYEKPEKVREVRAQWTAELNKLEAGIGEMAKGPPDADNEIAGAMLAGLKTYRTKMDRVAQQLEESAYDSATASDRIAGPAKEEALKVEQKLADLSALIKRQAGSAIEQMQAAESVALVAVIVTLVIAIGAVGPLTLLNARSIVQPLKEACVVAEAIAGGDLSRELQVTGRDESADMMRALARMQESLRDLVGNIRTTTDSIFTASGEISTGNQDLSGRTEQTASSLQQTSSSMEQLTGTVRQTADSARTANQLASSAAQAAQRGGEVVSQVVSNMEEISTSSRKIAEIIGVIDGIAFQTNILALNAAVEAARAGEQGRGFAVVAGEVRNLAQRSANAAKEIKSLIGASVEKVESGSRLVQDAGTTMTEIVSGVQRVTDIIGEITAAASEQSNELVQVNTAVTQLDQMTQQNAALVEQSAAAAESLKEQAARLATLVAVFRGSQGEGRNAAAPQADAWAPA